MQKKVSCVMSYISAKNVTGTEGCLDIQIVYINLQKSSKVEESIK